MRHRFSIVVENKAGVLARILGVISARGLNVESLDVDENSEVATAHAEGGSVAVATGLALITLVTTGDEAVVDHVAQKINQQVRVLSVKREIV
jgi:acetolactate synthase-1/3 small subunit